MDQRGVKEQVEHCISLVNQGEMSRGSTEFTRTKGPCIVVGCKRADAKIRSRWGTPSSRKPRDLVLLLGVRGPMGQKGSGGAPSSPGPRDFSYCCRV